MRVNEARKQCCLEIPESPMPKNVGFKKGNAWSDDGKEKALEQRRELQYLYGSDIAFLGLVMMLKASTMKNGGDSFNLQTCPMQENKEVALVAKVVARDMEAILSWHRLCEVRHDAAYCCIVIGARGKFRVVDTLRLGL